jgi:hypothetical protein
MRTIFAFIFLYICHTADCQYSLSGKITDEKTNYPIEYASLEIVDNELWAITNEKGEFILKNVSKGEIRIKVSCLGYVKKIFNVKVAGNMQDLTFHLQQDNLALKEVVITAKNKSDEMATSYLIDRVGLDHLQMTGVADITSLLPGGQTNKNLHLVNSEQLIALRSISGEKGNPTFGTAIEVDGVRLSNNVATTLDGVDTRNIATSGIESVELITGIPSVAYGDLTNGVVKINTRKGKTPYVVELSTKPNTKLFSLSKGFGLGRDVGVLNVNLEHAKSISDPASPYTSYDRNGLSLLYNNTFNKKARPLALTFGITGNIGGYDKRTDPDFFTGTYKKIKDNTFRAQAHLNYLLNRSWITNLEIGGTVSYSDKLSEEKVNRSSSPSTVAIHGQEEGYFMATDFDENPNAAIVIIPPGYWYHTIINDSKPIDITGNIKAKWVNKFGKLNSNILLGADFSRTGNKGKGNYYSDFRYAQTWREYRYDLLPYMNNLAVYLEDKMNLRIDKSVLQIMAGVRSDMTFIESSEYGTVSSFSPRLNAKYILPENKDGLVEKLSFRAGWGKSVKLPSFTALYPSPSYSDKRVFSVAISENESLDAYHILPRISQYNPHLKWQYSNQMEVGAETKIKGITITITAFENKIMNSYRTTTNYEPFTYNYTHSVSDIFPIPAQNRKYAIDQTTGIITVSDKTGQYSDIVLPYTSRNTFKSVTSYTNGSPILRRGLEWVVDFGKIPALQTSIRWDGNYYYYKGMDEIITAGMPASAQTMADGNPYKYIGFYVGGNNGTYNGSVSKQLRSNVTFTTHIPAVRFIVSLRLESSLYSYSRYLSEYNGQPYGFVLDDKGDNFPSATNKDIYAGDRFVGIYPLYYISFDDMNTKIPFAEALLNASKNDRTLYDELAKMVRKTNYNYTFNANTVSGYAFANINITKEIGNFASISFNATNFLNSMQLVKLSGTNTKSSLFGSSLIPGFYYGLSLKLKL